MLESRSSLSGATLIDQRVAQVKLLIVAIERNEMLEFK